MKYWEMEGASDALNGYKPKTEQFFIAWFGAAGAEYYKVYMEAYRSRKQK